MSKQERAALRGVWAVTLMAAMGGCSDGEAPLVGAAVGQAPSGQAPSGQASFEQASLGQGRTRDVTGVERSAPNQAKLDSARTSVSFRNGATRRLDAVAATGRTPLAAAEQFRKRSPALFGVDAEDLRPARRDRRTVTKLGNAQPDDGIGLMYDRATGVHKFRLYTYEQHRDGVPVYRSGLRTLVRQGGAHPVVWANAEVRAIGNFRPDLSNKLTTVDVDKSLQAARRTAASTDGRAPATLTRVSSPSMTIFAGVGEVTSKPTLAMTYTAESADGTGKWTFVADAETGDILHVESARHFDVQGTVHAEVTADVASMECGSLEVLPLPYVEVSTGASSTFTDSSGAFDVTSPSSGGVSLTAGAQGSYFDVIDNAGGSLSATLSVAPPGPANFLFRDDATPPELVLAQLNAYKHANDVRDMLLRYVPDYPEISGQTNFPIHVNRTDFTCETTGGAWYDNDSAVASLNFCQRTAERANTAFGSIIHHEYGHHIVEAGGSQQNEYGEGMADTIAMLFTKDPVIGVGYRLNCAEPLRLANRNCQYSPTECSSCGSGLYECGALLSGTIWDIWQNLEATDPEGAADLVRSLVLSSIPLHSGSKIDPSIAVDLLTLDDDDGLLENGTPHYEEICSGFAAHGMECPPIASGLVVKSADLDAEGPSGGPFEPSSVTYTLYNLGPEQNLTYTVTNPSNAPWLSIDDTGGTIALGGSVTVTVSLDQTAAAQLSDGDYTASIEFVNTTTGVGSVVREQRLRVGAPEPVFTARFSGGLDDFTVGEQYGNLWHSSTTCVDALPNHSEGGSLYYGKGDLCNYTTPVPIEHTVLSPPIALPRPDMVELGFNYLLETENDPNYDSAFISVSVDGGPFTVVASNNRGGEFLTETKAWRGIRFPIDDLLPAGPSTIRVQIAFNAGDPTSNTKTGFAVDDLVVYAKVERCANDAECDDGNFCNGEETCVGQACTPGVAPSCDDGAECTIGACDETNDACVYAEDPACGTDGVFIETNGQVVIEAEHFTDNTPRSAHEWSVVSSAGASGAAMVTAGPNSGQVINSNYAVTSPELTYRVQFSNVGTYYVWLRGSGSTADDDSCHVGIDGNELGSADRVTGFSSSLSWSRSTMDGPVASIQVGSAGVHEINLWMREDGLSVDKLVLTKHSSFTPTGVGPLESARAGAPQGAPCDNLCDAATWFTSSNYTSPNLGLSAACFQTQAALSGGVCGNFASSRHLYVNGVEVTCNWSPWAMMPPPQNGGYCIQVTAGDHPWASFTTW